MNMKKVFTANFILIFSVILLFVLCSGCTNTTQIYEFQYSNPGVTSEGVHTITRVWQVRLTPDNTACVYPKNDPGYNDCGNYSITNDSISIDSGNFYYRGRIYEGYIEGHGSYYGRPLPGIMKRVK